MDVTVFTESRYTVDDEGRVLTATGAPARPRWRRYLDGFDRVRVVARIDEVEAMRPQSPDDEISFVPVPYYVGAREFARRLPSIRRAVDTACRAESAFILRAPGRLASLAASRLLREGRPYGVEVKGDPWDVFAPGGVDHPLRPLFRGAFRFDLRRVVRQAVAASYVTDQALQARYPCPGFQIGISSVDLEDDALATSSRALPSSGPVRLVTVGSLENLYKGPDVLLEAVADCTARGHDLRLTWVGEGRHRRSLEARAHGLGLSERVVFRGAVASGAPVRRELDQAHLFVLPSRAEGLPRALIEAMARGLPCLASRVGGIPELLADDDLVPVGDAAALASAIESRVGSLDRWAESGRRNLARASDFTRTRLRARRIRFYREVLLGTLGSDRLRSA